MVVPTPTVGTTRGTRVSSQGRARGAGAPEVRAPKGKNPNIFGFFGIFMKNFVFDTLGLCLEISGSYLGVNGTDDVSESNLAPHNTSTTQAQVLIFKAPFSNTIALVPVLHKCTVASTIF